MSSVSTAYGVDLEKLTSLRGCKDAQLLAELEPKIQPDPFDDPGDPTVLDGLRALVNGDTLDSTIGRAQQLYGLEMLCEHVGKRLDGQGHVAYIDDLGLETALLTCEPPLDLPRADDFPSAAHLTAEQVRNEFARFADVETEGDDPEIEEGREELIGWLQQCADQGLALVVFQY